ncbi:MAG: two-component system response regulator [Ignavibacteria bacterium GWA2_35_9]|nr:MAG: two-component system response regulator [Ignavibacteria bacterium GWA2_35_9]OGU43906.1 MAG: two-component system response regulator [Ignavibacteria bacterium GWB2_36_8]OGU48629.1 MAG: two-component system response regulator [Ignavibacteria bacterium GWC2_36_12]
MENSKIILLAEDNPKDAELMFLALEGSNIDIVHVKDGAEALDYLYYGGRFSERDQGKPTVIFLDLKMPKLDGLQVVKQVRADENLKTIPIVMLTSSREEKDLAESYNLGANAYVVKPVTFDKFIETIKQIGIFWALINEAPI